MSKARPQTPRTPTDVEAQHAAPLPAPSPEAKTNYREGYVLWGLIALTLLLTSLPYLIGYTSTPPGRHFIGTAYNIDDFCNYLSWLRQNADGYFFYHNLFTTDTQKNLEFNVFFYALGRLMHIAHLSPQAVWQMARVGGGMGLLFLTYRFYRHCLPDDRAARLTAFGFVCLSSGFGWTTWERWSSRNVPNSPVDAWQPEAYTFLSLYTSALFTVSTLLILATLYALLKGEETGKWRYPILAGVCGAILGNMHSYDVLHLACAWGLFLIVWTILQRGRGVALSWLRGIAALALTVPTTLYQLYIFNAEETFHKRANILTLAPHLLVKLPPFLHISAALAERMPAVFTINKLSVPKLNVPNILPYALGYGFVFLLAVVAIVVFLRHPQQEEPTKILPRPLLMVACWAVGGFVAAYLPFAFQRKMLMGEHIPLCLLAGEGAVYVVRRWLPRPQLQIAVLALLVLATFPSNGFFLNRDINHLEDNQSETGLAPYLKNTLYDAYGWIGRNLDARHDAVLGFPMDCAPLPGATDRVVWCGHWAETPNYGPKLNLITRFADAASADSDAELPNPLPASATLDLDSQMDAENLLHHFSRRRFLSFIPAATYLLYPNDVSRPYLMDKRGTQHFLADFAHHPPPYLQPVYTNKDFTVFRIAVTR